MKRRRHQSIAAVLLAAACVAAGCGGGGSSTPTAPSTTTTPTVTTDPGTPNTITINASGVASPKILTVSPGTRVNFVNNDTRTHDMASDPHPAHTDCPELNQVGFLSPGQSRQSGNLNATRTCEYHDHNRPTDTALQGSIVIR